MLFRIIPYIVCAALLSVSIRASAAEEGALRQADAELEQELRYLKAETFVVTASKTVEHIKKSAASITVVTDREIRHMGARDLSEVLGRVPGLGITRNKIGVTEIEARGIKTFDSEKILVMLNGHPLNSNMVNGGATYAFADLPVENIRRIVFPPP